MAVSLAIASCALLLLQQAPVPDAEKQKDSEKLIRERIQIWGEGQSLKIFSLDYRQAK